MNANRKDINTARNGVELQHRHFSFIAATLCEMREVINVDEITWQATCRHFAKACKGTNPRFDHARFLAACGLKD